MEHYLDNSATTAVFPEVAELMKNIMCEDYGNPSSMHMKGVEAEHRVKAAKEIFCNIIKCKDKEIIFTSGGSESDNLAIIGTAMANKRAGQHIITTMIEHPAVLNTCKYLETLGFETTYLPVDKTGRIDLNMLRDAIRPDTVLVSIMHTNNEIGALQPIAEAGALIKSVNPNTYFHVDAVQGFGKAKINPSKMKIDLLSISGHKIHGPKGVGVLYVNEKVKINPIIFGGGQQQNLRSGTENVPGSAGIALAAKMLYENLDEETARLMELKKYLLEEALKIEGISANGLLGEETDPIEERIKGTAPHIVSLSFEGVRAQVLLNALQNDGVYVSAGSACSTHKPAPSATLMAIGLNKDLVGSTLRFSFSVYSTKEDIDVAIKSLAKNLPMLRKYVRR